LKLMARGLTKVMITKIELLNGSISYIKNAYMLITLTPCIY